MNEHTEISRLREVLLDKEAGINLRNRAAYWLREHGASREAREALIACLKETRDSQLLRHEIAYILGQLGHTDVASDLESIVRNTKDDEIVRHEAAEALGALGLGIDTLQAHVNDTSRCVAETCHLALENIKYYQGKPEANHAFCSVDPAPPLLSSTIEASRATLLNPNKELFERYRAMFALRDSGNTSAIQALCQALSLPKSQLQSDLLRHELAFVLGQIASPLANSALENALRDSTLHPMVRHEAAEALGALEEDRDHQSKNLSTILSDFQSDHDAIVAQSCQVALDAMAYYKNEQ